MRRQLKSGKGPGRGAFSQPRGVAILMVVAVLAGLIALAAPFVFSMVQHERAARAGLNALRAREGADAAVAHALAQLHKTLRCNPNDMTPEITALSGLKFPMEFPAAPPEFSKIGTDFNNPNGLLCSARVEDEQGKINLNTAPPMLVGNLLGSALLTEPAKKDDTVLAVDEPGQFSSDGDPATIDGLVCIGGELIPYRHVQGGVIVLQAALQHSYGPGTLVCDGRARLLTDYKFKDGGASFHPFRSIYEIRQAFGPGWTLAKPLVNAGRGMTAGEFARIERHVTVCSGMAAAPWGHVKVVDAPDSAGFKVESGEGFSPGTLVRSAGGKGAVSGFGRVLSARPAGMHTYIQIAPGGAVPGNYAEPEMKHPVNINTATREVMAACFTGLCLAASNEVVTRAKAVQLADFLAGGKNVFTSYEHLRSELERACQMGILSAAQRDAVYINASESGSPKLRAATVPFCFHSFGSYTIEGSGVVNAENGVQLARHTVRQLVTLPSFGSRFKIEYQKGMQELINLGQAPRMVTFPVAMSRYKTARNQTEAQYASSKTGDIRLDVGKSPPATRGLVPLDNVRDPRYRPDGYDLLKGNPLTPLPAASGPMSVEMWVRPMGGNSFVLYEQAQEDDRSRIIFSYEPVNGGGNALTLKIFDDGLECKPQARDLPMPKNMTHRQREPVECIYRTQLNHKEWYHVAASWKTSGYNGQEIRLDAQPRPDHGHGDLILKPAYRLSGGGIGIADTSFALEEIPNGGSKIEELPMAGAVRIGEEIIEYTVRNGTSLTGLIRGARMSTAAPHSDLDIVVPYGYSNALAENLPGGAVFLAERMETNCRTSVQTRANEAFIPDNETGKITVSSTLNFPPRGFITVDGELIYYGAKDAASFKNLKRAETSGGGGGPRRNLHNSSEVFLASIEVTANALNPSGCVQIADENDPKEVNVEWLYYAEKKTKDGKHFLVAHLDNTGAGWRSGPTDTYHRGPYWRPRQTGPNRRPDYDPDTTDQTKDFRANMSTSQYAHAKKAKVIPVVKMHGPHCGGFNYNNDTGNNPLLYGDNGVSEVSIVQPGGGHGDLGWIKRGYIRQWDYSTRDRLGVWHWNGWIYDFYMALNDPVSQPYPTGAHVMKWPSGELPALSNAQRHLCSDRNGGQVLQGHVDEVRVLPSPAFGARLAVTTETANPAGISSSAQSFNVEMHNAFPEKASHRPAVETLPGSQNPQFDPAGGLIRIDDELMYYTSAAASQKNYYVDAAPAQPLKHDRQRHYPHNPRPPSENYNTRPAQALSGIQRGVLGSKAVSHPSGSPVMLIDAMPVGLLTSSIKELSTDFSVSNGTGFPAEGYAWIAPASQALGGEVVSWTNGGGSTFSGIRPFRGRFGTMSTEHDAGELVRYLPFRHWDRQAYQYDGDGLAYVQAGFGQPGTLWETLELLTGGTAEYPEPTRVRPRVLVRFNGAPAWDAEPANQEGGLYEFRPMSPVISLGSRGIRADQMEMRVFWDFHKGAFQPSDEWKRTFTLQKLRATYHSPLIMRRLDEVEKR